MDQAQAIAERLYKFVARGHERGYLAINVGFPDPVRVSFRPWRSKRGLDQMRWELRSSSPPRPLGRRREYTPLTIEGLLFNRGEESGTFWRQIMWPETTGRVREIAEQTTFILRQGYGIPEDAPLEFIIVDG